MQKSMGIPGQLRLYFGAFLVLFLVSCNTKEEGCLDIRATNFTFDADKSCSDCCTYPKLFFRISHAWNDTLPFRQNQVYTTTENDTFRVVRLDYLFSDFRLAGSGGVTETIEENLDIWCERNGIPEMELIRDDLIVINLTNLTYQIGTFASDDLFLEGSCTLGLPDSYDCAIADSVSIGGPLATESILYNAELMRRFFGRMIIQKDTASDVMDTLFLPNTGMELNFDLNRSFRTGRPDTIFCSIRYEEWFESIRLADQLNETIIQQMTNNIPNSIFLE